MPFERRRNEDVADEYVALDPAVRESGTRSGEAVDILAKKLSPQIRCSDPPTTSLPRRLGLFDSSLSPLFGQPKPQLDFLRAKKIQQQRLEHVP